MPLQWYLTLLLVGGTVALVEQLLRLRFTRAGYLLSLGLTLVGGMLGASLAALLELPEVLQLTVEGEDFPLFWSGLGGAVFVITLHLIERCQRRRARIARA